MSKSLKQALDDISHLSSDEIASHLESLGVQVADNAGWEWSCRCPLAVHLTRETGREVAVTRICAYHKGDTEKELRLPQNIFNFVLNVDKGKYPKLVYRAFVGEQNVNKQKELHGPDTPLSPIV